MSTRHVARLADLPPGTLYALLRLRVDVFVVEQNCPYPELDGRDTEPATRHVWLTADPDHGPEPDRTPLAYLRILDDGDGAARIGRVCVAPGARHAGYGREIMAAGLELIGDRPCRLSAQSHLADFYAGFGFRIEGPEFLEDGIPHVPMYRGGRPSRHQAG